MDRLEPKPLLHRRKLGLRLQLRLHRGWQDRALHYYPHAGLQRCYRELVQPVVRYRLDRLLGIHRAARARIRCYHCQQVQ